MAYAKVTDGKEIRKFRVEHDLTFDALKKQVAGLFPSLAGGVDFHVQYRGGCRILSRGGFHLNH